MPYFLVPAAMQSGNLLLEIAQNERKTITLVSPDLISNLTWRTLRAKDTKRFIFVSNLTRSDRALGFAATRTEKFQ